MKIVIDIDEVVADFHGTFLDYYNLKYCKKVCLEDITEYKSLVFGDSRKEIADIFIEFFKSDDFNKMKLIKGALDGISFLDDNFDIVFVTARMELLKDRTFDFFKRFFPDRNFEIIFVGDDMFDGDKLGICQEFGCDLIIEDKGETCFDFAEKGIKSILIDKPWNQDFEHENICRCLNWDEIVLKIKEMKDE